MKGYSFFFSGEASSKTAFCGVLLLPSFPPLLSCQVGKQSDNNFVCVCGGRLPSLTEVESDARGGREKEQTHIL